MAEAAPHRKTGAWIGVVVAVLSCLLVLAFFARSWLDDQELTEWTNPIVEGEVSLPPGWRGGRALVEGEVTTFIFKNPGAGLVVNVSHEETPHMDNDVAERFWRAYPAKWAEGFEPRISLSASSFPFTETAMWLGCGRTESEEVAVRIVPKIPGVWRFVVLASGNARPDDAIELMEAVAMGAGHYWLDGAQPRLNDVPRPAARCTDKSRY